MDSRVRSVGLAGSVEVQPVERRREVRELTALIGGGVLLAAFLAWERRAAAPMLPLRLFRSRGFGVINAVAFAFSAGVFGSVFLLAQFFQVVQGLSPLEAGVRTLPWTMAPMVVGAAVVAAGRALALLLPAAGDPVQTCRVAPSGDHRAAYHGPTGYRADEPCERRSTAS